jgi:serine/threonine protein kinase
MPPEIIRGEHAVHRSDIFSLGVTLYLAASGEHPFLVDGEMVMRDDMLPRIKQGCALDLDDEQLARGDHGDAGTASVRSTQRREGLHLGRSVRS